MDEILDKLNEEQIKPVCDTEGAVLVLAGGRQRQDEGFDLENCIHTRKEAVFAV